MKSWIGVLIVLALAIAPASAVVWGVPDGEAHPYVVMLVVKNAEGWPLGMCTGSLIAPQVVLTAGHCTFPAGGGAEVWEGGDLTAIPDWPFGGMVSVHGTAYTHPGFPGDNPDGNRSDVGVVILEAPIFLSQYGVLPAIGAMDALAKPELQGKPAVLNVVGFGLQEILPNPHDLIRERIRYQGFPMIVAPSPLWGEWYVTTQGGPGEGLGQGNACFGDSGGPALMTRGSDVIGAVTAGGRSKFCNGGNAFFYRVDTAWVLDWIHEVAGEYLLP